MRSLLFCAVLLTAVFSFEKARSQNFEEGYVVTAGNDTLRGFVRETDDAVSSIRFKKALSDADGTLFRPAQVNVFFLKSWGEIYISKVVTLDIKPVKLDELDGNPSSKIVRDTVFLKILVKGKAALYQHADKTDKIHYFLQTDGGEIKELLRIRYRRGGTLMEVNSYRDQLKEAFQICAADYSKLGFNESELTKAVADYNVCTGSPSAFIQKKNAKTKGIPYVAIGASSGHGVYHGGDESTDMKSPVKPAFAFGLEVVPTKSGKHLSWGFELAYKQSALTGQPFVVNPVYQQTIYYSYSFINIGLFAKYTLPVKLKPYVKIGVGASSVSESKNAVYNTISGDYVSPLDAFSKTAFGYLAGAGVVYRKFFFEVRYDATTIQASSGHWLNATSLNLWVGYRLRKF